MTTKPKIELKNIKVHLGLSEETPAYTAKLYVDSAHFADVKNDGHGGNDYVYPPLKKNSRVGAIHFDNEELKHLEALIAATYPSHKFGDGMTLEASLEGVCHDLVWKHVDERNLRSRLSRTVFTLEDGKIFTYKGKKTDASMDNLQTKKPEAIILNRLPFNEASDLITHYTTA